MPDRWSELMETNNSTCSKFKLLLSHSLIYGWHDIEVENIGSEARLLGLHSCSPSFVALGKFEPQFLHLEIGIIVPISYRLLVENN